MSDAKNIKTLENSSVELTLTLPAARIEEDYKKTLDKYVKTAQIPGFRKGHVPASVLEKKFGDSLRTESTFDTMEKYLHEELDKLQEDQKPLPYCTPVLQDEEKLLPFKKDTDVTYSVKYDVKPQFELPQYTGLTVSIPDVKVSDEDVKKELDKLREQNAMVVEKKDGVAEDGNIVNIDYVELDGEGKEIASSERKDFTFTLGSGYNYYEIDKEIVGMKAGESKNIEKSYPEDFKTADLAGKTITLKVTLKGVKVKDVPELDDDFAQDIKDEYKSVDDLTKATREKLEEQLKAKLDDEKFEKISEELVKTATVPVPQSMVDLRLNQDWKEYVRRTGIGEDQLLKYLAAQGIDKESMLANWEKDAVKTISVQLILDKIKEKENFTVSKEELDKATEEQLKDVTDENMKKYYQTMLEENLKLSKVGDFLEANNTFTPGEAKSFDEYMHGKVAE